MAFGDGYIKKEDAVKVAEATTRERDRAIKQSLMSDTKAVASNLRAAISELKDIIAENERQYREKLNNIYSLLGEIGIKESFYELPSVGDAIKNLTDDTFLRYTPDELMPEDENSGLKLYEYKNQPPYYRVLAYARGEYVTLKRKLRTTKRGGVKSQVWTWEKGYKDEEVLYWMPLPKVVRVPRKDDEQNESETE